jgi:hypothetical protein
MQELDAFEKYLQEQLKGQAAPQDLMWKRLHDVIGKPKAWYAKSFVKYALTALTAATIGAGSTYVILNNKATGSETPVVNRELSQKTILSPEQEKSFASGSLPTEKQNLPLVQNLVTKEAKSQNLEQSTLKNEETQYSEVIAENLDQTKGKADEMIQLNEIQHHLQQQVDSDALQVTTSENSLQYLTPTLIQLDKKALIKHPNTTLRYAGLSLQLSTAKSFNTIKSTPYSLNNSASYTQAASTQQIPSLQIQYHFPKSWVLGLGIGQQQIQIAEHFYKTNVYSYDDKEHYWFNYAFGQRSISDEELDNGPWPFFPPNPFGSDTSHVHINYQSDVRFNILQIPLSFAYERRFGNFALQLSTGLSLNYIKNATQTLGIPGFAPSTIDITDQLQKWSCYQQQSLRFEYLANKHLGVYLEPSYLMQIQRFKSESGQGVKLNQMQLRTGISWKF